jgi:hypothetical protein
VSGVGRAATALGISQATQATILCYLTTAQRLMAPVQAFNGLVNLANTGQRVRTAIASGDYEGAALLLGRTMPTLPGTVTAVRDTLRLGHATAALVTGNNPQALTNYLQACFAAGTPILWEHGEKPVEEFRRGDRVWCRPENDPAAPVELKEIEETFVTSGPIWHLHVGGQVIRTTPEHPFWVDGKGWTQTADLEAGDVLVSHDGQTRRVEDILETAQWQPVYNFRVADHHTYFVGREEWGFSVWAHNLCVRTRTDTNWKPRRQGSSGTNVYGVAQNTTGLPADKHEATMNLVMADIANNATFVDPTTGDRFSFALNRDSWITMNRSLSTALGGGATRPGYGTASLPGGVTFGTARFRPDEVIVAPLPDGSFQVSMVEVASPGQSFRALADRMQAAWRAIRFPPGTPVKRGAFIVTDLFGKLEIVE